MKQGSQAQNQVVFEMDELSSLTMDRQEVVVTPEVIKSAKGSEYQKRQSVSKRGRNQPN